MHNPPKEYAIKIENHAQSREFLSQLLAQQRLDGNALGVLQRGLDAGIDSLSPAQLRLLNAAIHDAGIRQPVCSRCDELIPIEEVLFADNGRCSLCDYREAKDERLAAESARGANQTSMMTIKEAEEVLYASMRRLFAEPGLPPDVNERSLTHRLAVHLERSLAERGSDLSVDCEYNRSGGSPKRLQHLIESFAKTATPEELVRDTKGRTVFPDIVVHKRGTDGPNVIVIEAKRTGCGSSAAAEIRSIPRT
jgi:hypothetical protein